MSSIHFQERERTSDGMHLYPPFVVVGNNRLFSSLFAHRTIKVYESLARNPIDLGFIDILKGGVQLFSYTRRYEPLVKSPIKMGFDFLGLFNRERSPRFRFQHINKIDKSIEKSSIRTNRLVLGELGLDLFSISWFRNSIRIYESIIKHPIRIGFPYHSVLEHAKGSSIRYRLIQQVDQIFRNVQRGWALSEYSHENSSPPIFLRVGLYSNIPRNIDFYSWYSLPQPSPCFKMNCYGFVWKVVVNTNIKAGEELKAKMQELSDKQGIPSSTDGTPCPFNLAAIFKESDLKYWKRIQKLEEVEPGDILVYLPPHHKPSCQPSNGIKPTRTHVMFVQSIEKQEGGSVQFSILDSTRKAHCPEDSRFPKCSGIGNAPLTLIPRDEDQGIYLLQWGSNEKQQVKEFVIGRMIAQ